MIQSRETLTQREHIQMQYEREMWDKQAAHQIRLKELELEVLKTESRLSAWFKLPLTLVKLPVILIVAIGFVIGSFRKDYKPGEDFWKLVRP